MKSVLKLFIGVLQFPACLYGAAYILHYMNDLAWYAFPTGLLLVMTCAISAMVGSACAGKLFMGYK